MEEIKELEKINEETKERTCEGIINYVKCDKPATWKVLGHSARFGVPLTKYVCEEHREYLEKNPHPKIMEYNRFDVWFIPLDLGKCCRDMEDAIERKYLAIKNEEIVFNIAKTPMSAGNVITGEEYDPKKFLITMNLFYCPFCSSKLTYYQEDIW